MPVIFSYWGLVVAVGFTPIPPFSIIRFFRQSTDLQWKATFSQVDIEQNISGSNVQMTSKIGSDSRLFPYERTRVMGCHLSCVCILGHWRGECQLQCQTFSREKAGINKKQKGKRRFVFLVPFWIDALVSSSLSIVVQVLTDRQTSASRSPCTF